MLDRLGKQMTRDSFDAYAQELMRQNIDLRVFLIIGAPSISISEAMRWTRLSVRHAVLAGARHISLIPARSGHGWNGMADQLPRIETSHLVEIQQAAIEDAAGWSVVTVDLWDIPETDPKINQLRRRNLSQQ